MITQLEISGLQMEVSDELQKYIQKKIGRLDLYMSAHARKTVHAEVKVKEAKSKDKKECICEVVLHLPKETLTAKDSTINMFAAVDVVEAKLKNQLKKYKETHGSKQLHRRVISKLKKTAEPTI